MVLALVARNALHEKVPIPGVAELKAFNASAGGILGRHLAARFPGGRILILVRPGAENGQATTEESALLDGFRKSVEGRLQIAGIAAPQAPDAFREDLRAKIAAGDVQERDMGLMLSSPDLWFDTQGLADLIRAQPVPVSLVVSLTALPKDFPGRPEVAQSLPPFALMLAPALHPSRLLDSGRVEAMLLFKPPGAWSAVDDPSADPERAFESRYLLLHAGNREEVQRRHPEMFR